MSPEQAIRAGGLAITRRMLRTAAKTNSPMVLQITQGSKREDIHLTPTLRRVVLDALDIELSGQLLELGVSEYDETSLEPARDTRAGYRPLRLRKKDDGGTPAPA